MDWVKQYLSSGLTHREFCRRFDIGHNSLSEWKRQYWRQREQSTRVSASSAASEELRFQEVPLAAVVGGSWACELTLPNGTILRLTAGMPATLLKKILKGLPC